MVRQKDDMEKKKREKRKERKKNEVLKIYQSFDNKTFNITGKILLK